MSPTANPDGHAAKDPADENRQDRGSALRRRLAGQFVPQDHHRRGHRRLVGIHGRLRRAGPDRRHPTSSASGSIGQDPRPVERHSAYLYAATRQAAGGINADGDRARSRTRSSTSRPRRWACRSTRCSAARCATACSSTGRIAAPTARATPSGSSEWAGVEPVRSLDDIVALGAEVKAQGLQGPQDQPHPLRQRQALRCTAPAPATRRAFPNSMSTSTIVEAAVAQLEAFRRGAGPRCRAPSRHQLQLQDRRLHASWRARWSRSTWSWLEIDLYDPAGPRADPPLAPARRSPRSNRSTAGAISGRISSSNRSITRSSTWPGTASSNR